MWKALTLLNRSVRMHPGHTASWVALGLLNERNRRIEEARACFRTATKNEPRNHYAWLVSEKMCLCVRGVLCACPPTLSIPLPGEFNSLKVPRSPPSLDMWCEGPVGPTSEYFLFRTGMRL